MNRCDELNSAINDIINRTYRHPQNREQKVVGALTTIAATSLGCMLAWGALSLLPKASCPWERVRFTLAAGGVQAVPVGGMALYLYCKRAPPPEKSQKVVLKAMGIKADEVNSYECWASSLHQEVAKRAVAVADGLRPIEMLDEWVRITDAADNRLPCSTRLLGLWKERCVMAASMGLFAGSIVISLGAGANMFFEPKLVLKAAAIATVFVGVVLIVYSIPSILPEFFLGRELKRLDQLPETRYLTALVKARGDVDKEWSEFYTEESPAKMKVAELLGLN